MPYICCKYVFFHVSTALVVLRLLIVAVSRSHSDTPHSVESSGRVIGPLQRSVPDITHNIHETGNHAHEGFEPAIPAASQRPLTHALDRAAIGNGFVEVPPLSNSEANSS
jgi:hypothetical protein